MDAVWPPWALAGWGWSSVRGRKGLVGKEGCPGRVGRPEGWVMGGVGRRGPVFGESGGAGGRAELTNSRGP